MKKTLYTMMTLAVICTLPLSCFASSYDDSLVPSTELKSVSRSTEYTQPSASAPLTLEAFLKQYATIYRPIIENTRAEYADFLERDIARINHTFASKGAFHSGARQAVLARARADREKEMRHELDKLVIHGGMRDFYLYQQGHYQLFAPVVPATVPVESGVAYGPLGADPTAERVTTAPITPITKLPPSSATIPLPKSSTTTPLPKSRVAIAPPKSKTGNMIINTSRY